MLESWRGNSDVEDSWVPNRSVKSRWEEHMTPQNLGTWLQKHPRGKSFHFPLVCPVKVSPLDKQQNHLGEELHKMPSPTSTNKVRFRKIRLGYQGFWKAPGRDFNEQSGLGTTLHRGGWLERLRWRCDGAESMWTSSWPPAGFKESSLGHESKHLATM